MKTVHEKLSGYPKVKQFLSQKAINSEATKRIYIIALDAFQTFISNKGYDLETIIDPLRTQKTDTYELLNDFVSYLHHDRKMSPNGCKSYMTGIRSYLIRNGVNLQNFKRNVDMPKVIKGRKEQALTIDDIRNMLQNCPNRRLRAYLAVLASSGLRATEAILLRVKDVKFTDNTDTLTEINVRGETTKTKTDRVTYITWEATEILRQWLDWKKNSGKSVKPDSLIFYTRRPNKNTNYGVYQKILSEFQKVLEIVGLDELKDNMQRRKITLHSFRRWVFTTISNEVGISFANYILGHKDSYYTPDKQKDIDNYKRCEKYMTYLSYPTVQEVGRGFESKLKEKDIQIQQLIENQDRMMKHLKGWSDRMKELMKPGNTVYDIVEDGKYVDTTIISSRKPTDKEMKQIDTKRKQSSKR